VRAQIAALRSKTNFLHGRFQETLNMASNLDNAESTINELQTRRKQEQAQWELYSASVEKSKLDVALNTSTLANINNIQGASDPG
jgi:hypothetical protein